MLNVATDFLYYGYMENLLTRAVIHDFCTLGDITLEGLKELISEGISYQSIMACHISWLKNEMNKTAEQSDS